MTILTLGNGGKFLGDQTVVHLRNLTLLSTTGHTLCSSEL